MRKEKIIIFESTVYEYIRKSDYPIELPQIIPGSVATTKTTHFEIRKTKQNFDNQRIPTVEYLSIANC